MAPSWAKEEQDGGPVASTMASTPGSPLPPDAQALLEQLRDDRLWLLRQLDAGNWSEWRLDLAALERELGQLLEQAESRLTL
jgi:hypothetical protein